MMLFGIDLKNVLNRIVLFFYWTVFLPVKVRVVRSRPAIKVAFIVSDLGKWSTEELFIAMDSNDRFIPVIIVAPYKHYDNQQISALVGYLQDRNYNYRLLQGNDTLAKVVAPDIIIPQEPYRDLVVGKVDFRDNIFSLYCFAGYGFHWVDDYWILSHNLLNYTWQNYYENEPAIGNAPKYMANKGRNCLVTGLPLTDAFLKPLSTMPDPWKNRDGRKRIIWAPHHSIVDKGLLFYSTFFEYSDFMLQLAERYRDVVQIAFKPHPVLLPKLYEVWGKERTDSYYARWAEGENTQLEQGEYVSLFMHSDALIHDCGSFTVAYHYTRKPVLYLMKDGGHDDQLNDFGKRAFDLHYKGWCKDDIETFIIKVLDGKDSMKDARERFYNDLLLPRGGNSASESIMKAILGES